MDAIAQTLQGDGAPPSTPRSLDMAHDVPTRRQPALYMKLQFRPPSAAVHLQFQVWLRAVFDVAEEPSGPATTTGEASEARAWLQSVLLLFRSMLQAFNVPLFDAPQVLSLARRGTVASGAGGSGSAAPGPATFDAEVSLAIVEHLAHDSYGQALGETLKLATWAGTHAPDDSHIDSFCAWAEMHVAPRLAPFAGSRKSMLPVLRVAHQRGIPFMHLGSGVFQLGWGCHGRLMLGSIAKGDSALGARLCANKAMTAALLHQAGLPAPDHVLCATSAAALQAAQRLGWPVVVKPVDAERGEGVTVNLRDDASVVAAFDAALLASPGRSVLVERQIPGTCHRLVVTRGRLLYAVKRMPMSVLGDGVSSIAALVAAQCAQQRLLPTWQRSPIQALDAVARATLQAAGWLPDAVPPPGQWVALRPIESTAWGGVFEDVTPHIHPHNLAAALAAAELFGLEIAGIDIISPDIGQAWHQNGARINEVNFAPLLGGGAISRSHLPAYLADLVPGDGTLPVEVFVGGPAAWSVARARWQALVAAGQQAFLSDAGRSCDASGMLLPMPKPGLCPRTRALVLNPRVQALVLVVQTDEFIRSGLPLPAVSAVQMVDSELTAWPAGTAALPAPRLAALTALLQAWPRLRAQARASTAVPMSQVAGLKPAVT
ncbi:MAG: hypothetical protein QE285_19435 [Aquabacterium sp.]|nr:hypothetical protein [Aquabacterium sp.]